MKPRILLIGALLTCGAPTWASAQAIAPTQKEADSAVRAVVQRYLHGLKFNDTASLREAFWPEARLFFINREGKLGELTQAKWYAMFAGSIGKEEKGDLRITSVESTNDAASVKVVEDYPGSRYTDYLNLLRIDGRWWIVNKIYTVERRRN
ncbi:MAG TPA: nuclear transport factor 2 family protein [Gemmatimonadaceae bacterium]|nr:nuclear transport factor 2 family protein [Gemmatimonadaceae bacterium]